VIARNSDTGAEVVMRRTASYAAGSHAAEYDAALDTMGTWRIHMRAGGDRALLNTGDHSGIQVLEPTLPLTHPHPERFEGGAERRCEG
jgi:hypothetical protein